MNKEYKYQVGDIVICYMRKSYTSRVNKNKKAVGIIISLETYMNLPAYNIVICGIPERKHLYHEYEIQKKIQ